MVLDSCAQGPVAAPAEVVWDWMWDPANARWFEGYGPVAGVLGAEIDEMRTGSIRIIETSDGARLQEQLLEVDRPRRHRYLLSGIQGPLSWLVRSGEAIWDFRSSDGNTTLLWTYRFELTTPLVWPLARVVTVLFAIAQRRALRKIADVVGRGMPGPL